MTAAAAARGRLRYLRRLLSISSFRMSAVYALLFLLSALLLFEVVTWSVKRVARQQIDHDVTEETREVWDAARGRNLAGLTRAVHDFVASSPDAYYLLQSDAGAKLAGNLPVLAPVAGWRMLDLAPGTVARGLGQAVPGGYLFVGVDDVETSRLGHAISDAFVLSLAATLVLALGGGIFVGLSVLKRVEGINRATRGIMAGDLSRRIPVRGAADEFDQLAAMLNQMLDRIQGLMGNLQQVTSDIAHDLRTPLTRLRQRLEGAARGEHSAEALRETLFGCMAEVDAALATFSALLRIAQIESGSRRAGFAPVHLPALVQDLVETYQPVAEEAGQTLSCAGAALPAVPGDRPLLTQLLANLIENAIRHTPRGAAITARTAMIDGDCAIVVEDDGPGIAPEHRRSVLARFVRLEASRSKPGNGLGLALVNAIAALHGAGVMLEDNAPGLRVVIRFGAANPV